MTRGETAYNVDLRLGKYTAVRALLVLVREVPATTEGWAICSAGRRTVICGSSSVGAATVIGISLCLDNIITCQPSLGWSWMWRPPFEYWLAFFSAISQSCSLTVFFRVEVLL